MTADELKIPAIYVVTNDSAASSDTFAYTDDGVATAATREQAVELKDWIAYEFMEWDTAECLTVRKAVLVDVEYPVPGTDEYEPDPEEINQQLTEFETDDN